MDTGIPSFNTIISNCKYAFDTSWSTSCNKLVSSFRSSLVRFVCLCACVCLCVFCVLSASYGPRAWNKMEWMNEWLCCECQIAAALTSETKQQKHQRPQRRLSVIRETNRRKTIPPRQPYSMNLWAILKQAAGKELTRISMPVCRHWVLTTAEDLRSVGRVVGVMEIRPSYLQRSLEVAF